LYQRLSAVGLIRYHPHRFHTVPRCIQVRDITAPGNTDKLLKCNLPFMQRKENTDVRRQACPTAGEHGDDMITALGISVSLVIKIRRL